MTTLIMEYAEQLDKEEQLSDWITLGTALELYKTNKVNTNKMDVITSTVFFVFFEEDI